MGWGHEGLVLQSHSRDKHLKRGVEDGDDESGVKWKSISSEKDEDGEAVSSDSSNTPSSQDLEKNLRLVSFDADGSVVLRNISEESTVSLCGLSVSLFATDNDDEVSRFTFQDEIDLSPSTHLRLLFDNHARDPPAASVENLLDICVKGLKSSSSDSV